MSAKRKVVPVTVEISETVHRLLAVLDANGSVENVLLTLIDHAQQGVYRPGAWERVWLIQVFCEDWETRLVPGDPYGRPDCEGIFQKPNEAK